VADLPPPEQPRTLSSRLTSVRTQVAILALVLVAVLVGYLLYRTSRSDTIPKRDFTVTQEWCANHDGTFVPDADSETGRCYLLG
jgi:hypothetical protein